jgi:ABC-2 type transport system permease protein
MLNFTGALIYCVIISFFWFLLQFTTGLITFWMEETWILRVIITVISSFLSGYYYPLDLYPEIMQTILKFTPFPYLSYYPSKLFMHFSLEIFTQGLMVLALWALPLILINRSLWKRGLKQYSGAGI